ncbi:trypsin-like serine protease [Solihabitans fulvus]|uniref:Trypsin-like serine protease n=1 Tax=Solihabitans fulvus TaxID=1892852 RepID=A0A5B2XCR5_9PSEU|nr:trypsin-like serine protease [Solihabitans fulvus]KAA2260974.1 trypsin-like serine protease [Solihabitans fulvus]
MRFIRLILPLAAVALAVFGAAPAASAQVSPHIIDGQQASSGPWAARLFVNGQQECSATIIAPQWVLTARHCVQSSGTYTFHIGSLDQTAGESATAVEIDQSPDVDLALAKLDHEVQATYAPLGDSSAVNVGDTVQLYGWGATCTDRPEIQCQSRYLKYANVQVSDTGCDSGLGGLSICVTRIDGIAAGGDSGGPMFATSPVDGQQYQVGVASTSDRSSYSAYANVTQYRDWIQSIAGV